MTESERKYAQSMRFVVQFCSAVIALAVTAVIVIGALVLIDLMGQAVFNR